LTPDGVDRHARRAPKVVPCSWQRAGPFTLASDTAHPQQIGKVASVSLIVLDPPILE